MGRVSGPELDSQVSCNRMAHFVRKGCWSVAAQTSGDVGVTPSIVDPRTKKELENKTLIQRVSVQIQPLLHGTRLSGQKQRRGERKRVPNMRHDTTSHDREGPGGVGC
jgi:hypothetical protein